MVCTSEIGPDHSPGVCYVLNERDVIVGVNPQWTEFAIQNNADDLLPANVVGRSIWGFIRHPLTRMLYRRAIHLAREGVEISLKLRCDAPSERRLLDLAISRKSETDMQFTSRIISTKAREYQPLLDRRTPRCSNFLLTCSWCNRLHRPGDGWTEVEYNKPEPDAAGRLPRLEYIICSDCLEKLSVLVDAPPPEREQFSTLYEAEILTFQQMQAAR